MIKLNYKDFTILSFTTAETRSCAKFKYKGYIISMSTVFEPNIKIYSENLQGELHEHKDCESIELAIKFIDSLM